jgi:co-chaperonin GroES (HSP10)
VTTSGKNLLRVRRSAAVKCLLFLLLGCAAFSQNARTKSVGTVKTISGNSIVLTNDIGGDVTVTLTDATRIVRATPGQTDLKSAAAIQASDIRVGDRVLAVGASGEGNSVAASTVVVMKQTDIAQKQQQERDEWRKGTGGIVKEVNPPAGTITVANSLASSGKPIVVHVSSTTSIKRYSPDSVNFDDAKPSTLNEVKPGDQIRARGTKSDDGSEFTAQAVVSGTFRNIAGTVMSTDAGNNRVTVMDLVTKHPVTLKISAESQMHKLPPPVAQRLAARLKGGPPSEGENSQGVSGEPSPRGQNGQGGPPDGSPRGESYRRGGGSPDFQQMLSRMPSIAISDLQKGDAVMLVATEGTANSAPIAITLISGVEPILAAAPGGAAASILTPWNLGSSPGGEGATD